MLTPAQPTKALFAKAKTLLVTGQLGWTQAGKYFQLGDDDNKLCACLVGAVAIAVDDSAAAAAAMRDRYVVSDRVSDEVFHTLANCAAQSFPERFDQEDGITNFNDDRRTSFADIVKVLDCAIECAPA
jgi:hypothetical protein